MKRIQVFKANGCWMADNQEFYGGKWQADSCILGLFGTAVLPTAFTDQADKDMVVSKLLDLNPGVPVYAREDR